jgi:hypothetical protein
MIGCFVVGVYFLSFLLVWRMFLSSDEDAGGVSLAWRMQEYGTTLALANWLASREPLRLKRTGSFLFVRRFDGERSEGLTFRKHLDRHDIDVRGARRDPKYGIGDIFRG